MDYKLENFFTCDMGSNVNLGSTWVTLIGSGVARAFPDGRVAYPEGQNEEENEQNLRRNKKNSSACKADCHAVYLYHL